MEQLRKKIIQELNEKIEHTRTDCYYNFGYTENYPENNFIHEFKGKWCCNMSWLKGHTAVSATASAMAPNEYQIKRIRNDVNELNRDLTTN
jgi:hypothetical protein